MFWISRSCSLRQNEFNSLLYNDFEMTLHSETNKLNKSNNNNHTVLHYTLQCTITKFLIFSSFQSHLKVIV